MTNLEEQKLHDALRGNIQADPLTNRLMETVADEDLHAIRAIVDDMLQQAENRGRLSVYLEIAAESCS